MNENVFDFSEEEFPEEEVAAFEDITPEKAALMLSFNVQNRKINQGLVDQHVRQILDSRFKVNGETVKISRLTDRLDENGNVLLGPDGKPMKTLILLDGQHRLEAIRKSGKTVRTLVVRGLDPAVQSTIDIGRKRTSADHFRITKRKESANLAALLSGIWKWKAGDRKFGSNPKPTPIECEELLASDEARFLRSLDIGLQTGRGFLFLSKSALAIAHYLISEVEANAETQYSPYFFRLIETGYNLEQGHPVAALRKRSEALHFRRDPRPMSRQVGLVVTAWNRCVENTPVKTLVQTENEPVDDPLNPMGRHIPMLDTPVFEIKE